MDLGQIKYVGVDWIHLAQHTAHWWAHVVTVMNLSVT
jgi:hypothetical protein